MGFALDMSRLMQRAGLSSPASAPTPAPASASPANPASRLATAQDIGRLATLAGVATSDATSPKVAEDPTTSEAIHRDAVAWTDADIAAFLNRRARLLRWGWAEPEAKNLAERLTRRDREADPRVSCADCMHFRPWRCGNPKRAGLNAADVGPDLVRQLQRCPGFAP